MIKVTIHQKRPFIVLATVALLIAGIVIFWQIFSRMQSPATTFSASTELMDVMDCLQLVEAEQLTCLDDFMKNYLASKDNSVRTVLAEIEQARSQSTELENSCHPIVHAVGRNTFQVYGNVGDAFEVCDQTCHSGCYHGVMERLFFGDEQASDLQHLFYEDMVTKIPGICSKDKFSNPTSSVIFQCLHGVGHAILYSLDYNLVDSLRSCDLLADDYERSSCHGGVFMENVTAFEKKKRDIDPENPLHPCDTIDQKYRSSCYMMQTSIMFEQGLSVAQIADQCRKAGANVHECFVSLGRDLSNSVRVGSVDRVVEACEEHSTGYEDSCISGTVYALIDNTWDGKFAYQFCDALAVADNKSICYSTSNSYLGWSYNKSNAEIEDMCRKFAGNVEMCVSEL